jgi:hypothetical protein
MKNFLIRLARDEDRARVTNLVAKMSLEDVQARYDWLYQGNPHGRALTWLALDQETGEAVGCTSVFPRRVVVDGLERVGSMGGDCYIEPAVRRRGLATRLHLRSFADMRGLGVDFMYGPPVPNNLAALMKAGSRVVTNFKRWSRPLTGRGAYEAMLGSSPSELEARLTGWPILLFDKITRVEPGGLALERIDSFGSEFDDMFHRSAASHKIVCVRDASFLAWRYLSSPTRRQIPIAVKRDGELTGFVALEFSSDRASIVDLFCAEDPNLIDAILQLVLDRCLSAGCSGIEVSLTSECLTARRLRRFGFVSRDERGFQVAIAAHAQGGEDSQAAVLNSPNAWHFTMADKDMDTVFSLPVES